MERGHRRTGTDVQGQAEHIDRFLLQPRLMQARKQLGT
jgi:hypothetical protein